MALFLLSTTQDANGLTRRRYRCAGAHPEQVFETAEVPVGVLTNIGPGNLVRFLDKARRGLVQRALAQRRADVIRKNIGKKTKAALARELNCSHARVRQLVARYGKAEAS